MYMLEGAPAPAVRVHVLTSDALLRRALRARLASARFVFPDSRDGAPPPSRHDVVLATTSDLPSERCAELASAGVRVVMLAAVPRERERSRYTAAGAAAYLPMTADGSQLVAELRALGGGGS